MILTKASTLFMFSVIMLLLFSNCNQDAGTEIEGMVFVPAGDFIIGSKDEDTHQLAKEFGARQKTFFMNERPMRKLYLAGFYIDKYEITNTYYKRFIESTGYLQPPNWKNGTYMPGRDMHSVTNISWFDAEAFCRWTGKRLPKEEEWEKAARGPNGNKYPWGDEFDENKANLKEGDTIAVGSMPEDKSYYGVYDMAGNLMEWTDSWYKPYPGSTFQLKEYGKKYRVLRGGTGNIVGHYNLIKIFSRSSYRHYYFPNGKTTDVGFRCVRDK